MKVHSINLILLYQCHPKEVNTTLYWYFLEFFDVAMIEYICTQTNLYYRLKTGNSGNFATPEVSNFLKYIYWLAYSKCAVLGHTGKMVVPNFQILQIKCLKINLRNLFKYLVTNNLELTDENKKTQQTYGS